MFIRHKVIDTADDASASGVVAVGLDLGKEGPLVHIVACIASLLGQGGPDDCKFIPQAPPDGPLIKRCGEMARKLRFLKDQMPKVKKGGMPPGPRAGFSMCVHKKRTMLFGEVFDMEAEGDVLMSFPTDGGTGGGAPGDGPIMLVLAPTRELDSIFQNNEQKDNQNFLTTETTIVWPLAFKKKSRLAHPDQPSITFTTSNFNPLLSGEGGGGPIPFDLSLPIAKQNDDGSIGYSVLPNNTCQHAAPTFVNLMNAVILRLATHNENMTIQIRNHPMPMTESQHLQHQDLDAFSVTIVVYLNSDFIRASFVVPIVKEHEVKVKHQQLISGVSILSYWVSTHIWDIISFLVPSLFAIILFYIFGSEQFIGNGVIFPTVLILLEYGFATASSTYCLTFFSRILLC
ncbi:unnamed protein product [Lactuca virosa]|uniref:ABC-2 type transporter transmembrane domain-containing protein n=1 Tax=Lactuca virosa TaxID=75947 RepID=A0AAU9PIB7_9ASTR|nr:unnamed protein product [Lactuca virosa]